MGRVVGEIDRSELGREDGSAALRRVGPGLRQRRSHAGAVVRQRRAAPQHPREADGAGVRGLLGHHISLASHGDSGACVCACAHDTCIFQLPNGHLTKAKPLLQYTDTDTAHPPSPPTYAGPAPHYHLETGARENFSGNVRAKAQAPPSGQAAKAGGGVDVGVSRPRPSGNGGRAPG